MSLFGTCDAMCSKKRIAMAVIFTALMLAQGCSGARTNTSVPGLTPTLRATQSPPDAVAARPSATHAQKTPLPQAEPTALPSDIFITWGESWYEGEYLADPDKYPADPQYHDRSFNIRVTIRNNSSGILPGNVLPVFYLTDGEGERPIITWYYSQEDLRALAPGEKKEAVFRAMTYAPGQWISRAEIVWRGQVWQKQFTLQ